MEELFYCPECRRPIGMLREPHSDHCDYIPNASNPPMPERVQILIWMRGCENAINNFNNKIARQQTMIKDYVERLKILGVDPNVETVKKETDSITSL